MNRTGVDTLAQLLRGEWPDPDGGAPIGVPVRAIVIERSLAGSEADLVASLGYRRRIAVVSDTTTRAVLGARVERALASLATIDAVELDGRPHADAQTAAVVLNACARADAIVAVGSGTINDLCKFAAAKAGKPYAVFATAPSMNGYASKNAAITVDGHKMSLAAVSPDGVFMDIEILSAAPPRMIRAGLGDSLCRSTAQADWLLSHHVRGTTYRRAPFALLEHDEPVLLDESEALLRGDAETMEVLARTLVLSGLGMTICDGSHPASQGEHLISHFIDMFAPSGRNPFLHGEQVGVATLTMAGLQERVLAAGPPTVRPVPIDRATLEARFGYEIGGSCWGEFSRKRLTRESISSLMERWDEVRASIESVRVPSQRLRTALQRAGCATEPAHIELTDAYYSTAVRDARFLRDRYTFLDLAADAVTTAVA